MKPSVKTLVFFTIAILSITTSFAQLKLPLAASGFANDVRKVIDDYPNGFANLKGEMIMENPQSADYKCNFAVRGAEQATITQYSAIHKNISSWQALLLTTESFEEAKKKFRSAYTDLNNLGVKTTAAEQLRLKGKYETPVEEKSFTSVLLTFGNAHENLQRLKVEVVMQYELLEWKVRVLVYDREREDDERGSQKDE